ncbi:MAG TPA: ATP-binding cassette domain-containing protein, partial [Burkholderiaceae bacterium]|nr:ATP-binding cassette domain-containing protein [Burkholderiaceae bacterium]
MLALEGVSVDLAGVPVLRAVTARIDAGTTTAIVGRNGAGKTTLLRTTMGFVKPTRGRIVFDGAELHRLPPHARAALG